MTTQTIDLVEAPSIAAFAAHLAALPHEYRGIIAACELGDPWAAVEVKPLTDGARTMFPVDRDGQRGDTRRRGQAGALITMSVDADHAARVIANRSRIMWDASSLAAS